MSGNFRAVKNISSLFVIFLLHFRDLQYIYRIYFCRILEFTCESEIKNNCDAFEFKFKYSSAVWEARSFKPLFKIQTTWHCCLVWGFAHRILFNGILCWLIMKFGTNSVKIRFRIHCRLTLSIMNCPYIIKLIFRSILINFFNYQERDCIVFDMAGLPFVFHWWFFNVSKRAGGRHITLKKIIHYRVEVSFFLSVSTCKTTLKWEITATDQYRSIFELKLEGFAHCIFWNIFSEKQWKGKINL